MPNVINQNVVPNVINQNVVPNVINQNVINPNVINSFTNSNQFNKGYFLPNGTFVNYTQDQLQNLKCKGGQAVNVFGDNNYAYKSYRHWMAFIIVAAILLAIIAFILLIAVCTDSLSSKVRIILTVLGLMLLFALAVVIAIMASQTNL